jgi:hypothetical protein
VREHCRGFGFIVASKAGTGRGSNTAYQAVNWVDANNERRNIVGTINVIFDGPPAHESGRFVEVEDESGASIKVGEWKDRGDGTWALVLSTPEPAQPLRLSDIALCCNHGYAICARCDLIPSSWNPSA